MTSSQDQYSSLLRVHFFFHRIFHPFFLYFFCYYEFVPLLWCVSCYFDIDLFVKFLIFWRVSYRVSLPLLWFIYYFVGTSGSGAYVSDQHFFLWFFVKIQWSFFSSFFVCVVPNPSSKCSFNFFTPYFIECLVEHIKTKNVDAIYFVFLDPLHKLEKKTKLYAFREVTTAKTTTKTRTSTNA